MNLKLIVAISVIAAMPVCAQAQKPRAAKVTKADAENVVEIIGDDKAKTRTYCDIVELANQFEEADQKNDTQKKDQLSQRMDELVAELGTEYTALNEGLEDLDPNSKDSTDTCFHPRGARQVVCEVATGSSFKLVNARSPMMGPSSAPLLGATVGNGQPTPAMKRFADSLVRQKDSKPPPGYKTSISISRKFLNEHAPKKAEGETPGKLDFKPGKPGTDAVRQEDRAGERPHHSRGGQGQLSCHVRVDRLEPKHEASQAPSRDRLQAGGISCASIDGADEEVSETQIGRLCGSTGFHAAKFGNEYAATDSLWQQGGRSEAWRPLSLGWMVCPTWS